MVLVETFNEVNDDLSDSDDSLVGGANLGCVYVHEDGEIKTIGVSLQVATLARLELGSKQAPISVEYSAVSDAPDDGTWSDAELCLHIHKSGASGAAIGNLFYCFGGLAHDEYGSPVYTNTVTVLDLDAMRWRPVNVEGMPPSPRDKFGLFSFGGSLYVFGGYGPHPQPENCSLQQASYVQNACDDANGRGELFWNNSLHRLDTCTETGEVLVRCQWTELHALGDVPDPRAACCTAVIGYRAYVFGGRFRERRRSDLHCLDLIREQWSGELAASGDLPCGRSWATLTATASSKLVLCGGYDAQKQALDNLHIFHPDQSLWQRVDICPGPRYIQPRYWHTARAVGNDVFVLGGFRYSDMRLECKTVMRVQTVPQSLTVLCLRAIASQNPNASTAGWPRILGLLFRDLQSTHL